MLRNHNYVLLHHYYVINSHYSQIRIPIAETGNNELIIEYYAFSMFSLLNCFYSLLPLLHIITNLDVTNQAFADVCHVLWLRLAEGMPKTDWVFRFGTKEESAHYQSPYLQLCF